MRTPCRFSARVLSATCVMVAALSPAYAPEGPATAETVVLKAAHLFDFTSGTLKDGGSRG
jgi:hypothetical protein